MPYHKREEEYQYLSRGALWNHTAGPAREAYFHKDQGRLELVWLAGENGKPGINADFISATEGQSTIACREFEILGTSAVRTCSTYGAEGGVVLTTVGAANDQVIMLPHLDAITSLWNHTTWGTDNEVQWEALIGTEATITGIVYWAGLKMSNTHVTATDADQCFFRYADATLANWQAIYSIGGTDTETDSEVVAAASTMYHLAIKIDQHRIARMYIDGVLVNTSTALTALDTLEPYIGVMEIGTTVGKAITVYGTAISRTYGA